MRPAVLTGRLKELTKHCKTRGGDCSCLLDCQAVGALAHELLIAARSEREAADRREALEQQMKRIQSPIATLAPGALAACPSGYRPVMVFDGEEASFGFENDDGDWIEAPWPFEQEYVWFDDCTKNGIECVQA